jgi:hypothetical protein
MVRHRWSTSTSFVLAALGALHVDSCGAVTGSATIEEGTSPHRRGRAGNWAQIGDVDPADLSPAYGRTHVPIEPTPCEVRPTTSTTLGQTQRSPVDDR